MTDDGDATEAVSTLAACVMLCGQNHFREVWIVAYDADRSGVFTDPDSERFPGSRVPDHRREAVRHGFEGANDWTGLGVKKGMLFWLAGGMSVVAIGVTLFFVRSAPPRLTPAVYLRHVGASDKPIRPVVVCEKAPTSSEIQEMLRGDVAGTQIVSISRNGLATMIAVCRVALEGESATDGREYGTFEITVVGGVKKLVKTVSPAAAGAVFSEMRRASGGISEELQTTLEGLQGRVGVVPE